ncbi:MAG TPA: hypothetical protein VEZ11_19245 [Thermoanaerobaculia bacterium]|nr:hypothetical protein [Thermoanaerobaculia bacterium]
MKKIMLGGLLGGLALFAWSFIAHLPPVGTAGEKTLTPEQGDVVLKIMHSSMKQRAIYILPGMNLDRQTPADKDAWLAKFEAGPAAVIAFNPHPAEQAFGGGPFATWMLIELVSDIAAAFLGAAIASGLSNSLGYWPRVLLLTAIGLLATIDIDVSYWNWFAFPTKYLLAQFVDHVGGWFVTGLVLARVCRS